MNRKQKVALALFQVTIVILMIEIPLRIFDPEGFDTIYDNIDVNRGVEPYELVSGTYEFETWSATIQSDGTRLTPNSLPGDCHIIGIGDSVTLGWGINDDEVWLNQLAILIPGVEFINAGVQGYHSGDILERKRDLEADHFLYLITHNDVQLRFDYYEAFLLPGQYDLYLVGYTRRMVASYIPISQSTNYERFWSDLDAMTGDGDTLIINNGDIAGVAERYPGSLSIEWEREPISFFDGHPTAENHKALASTLEPYIRELTSQECGL
jgi:hypothetical protein